MYCKREQDAVSITSHVNPQNDIINVINYLTVMTKEDMQLFDTLGFEDFLLLFSSSLSTSYALQPLLSSQQFHCCVSNTKSRTT